PIGLAAGSSCLGKSLARSRAGIRHVRICHISNIDVHVNVNIWSRGFMRRIARGAGASESSARQD
ncbi:MAG: hypothetical protein U1A06_09435, partial [Hoeflea sp.]|nr:hypothetical protein [Hoeflea sp.]